MSETHTPIQTDKAGRHFARLSQLKHGDRVWIYAAFLDGAATYFTALLETQLVIKRCPEYTKPGPIDRYLDPRDPSCDILYNVYPHNPDTDNKQDARS